MALYAQFYVNRSEKLVRGLGDRAIIRLDGRNNRATHHELARDWIRRHESSQDFVAYRLFTGDILRPHYVTPVLRPDGREVPPDKVDEN